MTKLKGLTGDWIRFPHVAQEMIENPDAFFKTNKVGVQDFACPEEVHAAIARGKQLGEAISSTCAASEKAGLPLPEAVKALKRTVAQHFGNDFLTEGIPFGLLFKERAKPTLGAVTPLFTGTGTCTFCKDNDSPDVD